MKLNTDTSNNILLKNLESEILKRLTLFIISLITSLLFYELSIYYPDYFPFLYFEFSLCLFIFIWLMSLRHGLEILYLRVSLNIEELNRKDNYFSMFCEDDEDDSEKERCNDN